jgi:hypothetical protein
MAKQAKTQQQMKVKDAMYNGSVTINDLFQKIREQDAMITLQKENITLLKRQLALQDTAVSKLHEFISQLQQSRYLSENLTAQAAKKVAE